MRDLGVSINIMAHADAAAWAATLGGRLPSVAEGLQLEAGGRTNLVGNHGGYWTGNAGPGGDRDAYIIDCAAGAARVQPREQLYYARAVRIEP